MSAIFYAPEMTANPVLPSDESHHCVKVLRLSAGAEIEIVDGKGNWAKAEIVTPDPRGCVFRFISKPEQLDPPAKVTLLIAPPKNISRFEWMLEKVTEVGVHCIQPILATRSERNRLKPERLNRILVGAMKQSQKAHLPILEPLEDFEQAVERYCQMDAQLFLAHLTEEAKPLAKICKGRKPVVILIGPEGDFTEEEVKFAESNGFQTITLGPYRLRTETAGLVACHTVQLINQD